ncbi:uncharacterized protein PRCAT00003525001 [Priceomyces carsonii]|uniref:uncharacterized protein n=1 Tax=Priceomyces carsonii TaxID=28549 RepID=UPI002ED7EAF7|nr:unnamed protein product [Priceomyces carsonii]
MVKFNEITLKDWSFRQIGEKVWKPARKGFEATEIHPDLYANGDIPDPFLDDNEKTLQWIGEKDWEYKTTFEVDKAAKAAANHELIFEGLDTFAEVYLNEEKILETENMFIIYRTGVNDSIKIDGENELRIVFKSALWKGRELEETHGRYVGSNGEITRMQIRKAQYHYGWDWGPVFMTCGPYRPIKLQSYDSSLKDVYVKIDVNKDLKVNVDVQCDIVTKEGVTLSIKVTSPDGELVKQSLSDEIKFSGVNSTKFEIENPDLWFPFSHGKPSLYNFEVSILEKGISVQTWSKNIGFRRMELVQEPLDGQPGTSFYFRVNNVPVYSSGSDWIPAHSFQTCMTKKDYTEWMEIMADGNQNMLRIWGGGYYEQDILYEECDRLGILIWHDLMFACGIYPAYPEYMKLVKEEVISQMKRLRNYCSMALVCGNNEDYQLAEQFKLTWDKEDHSGDYTKTDFPARTFYEGLFPQLVDEYTTGIPYHPGSPWGGKSTNDPTIGDIHQWNVWHGKQEKYQDWYKLGGRFVSEFGMEGLPSRKTYEDCITDATEMYPQSYMIDHHNKSKGFERRLALYVMENLKVEGLDLDSWIYATQLMQSECLGYAYRCWRREWREDGKRYLGGALVWQINDCWPCASWAIVDHYKRPKLAYYSVKRESKPLGIGLYRTEHKNPNKYLDDCGPGNTPPFDYREIDYKVDIWGVNSGIDDVPAILKIDIYNVTSGEKVDALPDEDVVLRANQTTEFVKDRPVSNKFPAVVYARVVSKETGTIIASAADWPQPLKYLKFPGREVSFKVKDGSVIFSTNKPVKGVEIILEKDLHIDDNGFDIFPEDEVIVKVKGLKSSDKIKIRYYQQYK